MMRKKIQLTLEKDNVSILSKPNVNIEYITPEIAEKLLERNPENRKLQPELVTRYSNEMQGGRWKFNNSSIALCTDNTLMDGQHRLAAIVKSGMPIEMIIVRNLERAAFSTIDVGKKRNLGDLLTIRGYNYTSRIASSIRLISMLEEKKEIAQHRIKSRIEFSLDELFAMCEQRPDLQEDCAYVINTFRTIVKYTSPAPAIALYHIFKKKDQALTLELFNSLNTGHMLDMNSTIYQCRELLIKHRTECDMGRYTNPGHVLYLIIRTWNLLRNNIRDIRLVDVNKAPIPVII